MTEVVPDKDGSDPYEVRGEDGRETFFASMWLLSVEISGVALRMTTFPSENLWFSPPLDYIKTAHIQQSTFMSELN